MGERDYGVFGHHGDIAVVRRVYDAFALRDIEGVLACMAPGVEFFPAGTAKLAGREQPYRGHDGVRGYFADAEALWQDLVLDARDVRAAAGGVVVFGQIEGHREDEVVRRRAMWSWKLRDGLVVSMRATDLGPA